MYQLILKDIVEALNQVKQMTQEQLWGQIDSLFGRGNLDLRRMDEDDLRKETLWQTRQEFTVKEKHRELYKDIGFISFEGADEMMGFEKSGRPLDMFWPYDYKPWRVREADGYGLEYVVCYGPHGKFKIASKPDADHIVKVLNEGEHVRHMSVDGSVVDDVIFGEPIIHK